MHLVVFSFDVVWFHYASSCGSVSIFRGCYDVLYKLFVVCFSRHVCSFFLFFPHLIISFCLCHKSEPERPSVRWLSRLNMAAVGYAERERIRQEQGEGSLGALLTGASADGCWRTTSSRTKHTNTPIPIGLTVDFLWCFYYICTVFLDR